MYHFADDLNSYMGLQYQLLANNGGCPAADFDRFDVIVRANDFHCGLTLPSVEIHPVNITANRLINKLADFSRHMSEPGHGGLHPQTGAYSHRPATPPATRPTADQKSENQWSFCYSNFWYEFVWFHILFSYPQIYRQLFGNQGGYSDRP